MKRIRISVIVTILVYLMSEFAMWAVVWGQTPPMGPPVRRALLIGIGKYDVLPHLPGAKNDVVVVQQVLTQKFGFSPQHIQVLADAAATREGILSALRNLAQSAGPHDVLYVHYSGHGSQVQDLNGDEQDDQLDETIVPVNGRTKGIPDITDDELDAIFSALKTPHAVFVFDSCHSGTVTRGDVAVRTRFVPPDTRVDLYRAQSMRTRGVVPLRSRKYVLLTGAASNQQALDGPVNGKFHGFFTYSLFKSLSSVPPQASTRDVYRGIQHELGKIKAYLKRRNMPEPQLEGQDTRLDQPLFPLVTATTSDATSSARPRLSWYDVKSMEKGKVRIINGGLEGAHPWSVWALYPPRETQFEPGKARAYGLTLGTSGQDVLARVEPNGASISDQARAVLLVPAAGSGTLRVQFREGTPDQHAMIKQVLDLKMRGIVVVGPEQEAEFVVDTEDDQVQVLSGDGLEEVASFPMKNHVQLVENLTSLFSRSLTVKELLALENPSSQIQLDASIVKATTRGVVVVADRPQLEDLTGYIRKVGEPRSASNSLQLRIRSNVDCFLTIVDVDAEGGVNVLFPNDYQKLTFYPDGFVHGGESVIIPDSLGSSNQAGFHWDYANPPGTDTIRIFASTDLPMAELIREQIQNVSASMMVATRSGEHPLEKARTGLQQLRAHLVKTMTRGVVVVPDEALVHPATDEQEHPIHPGSPGLAGMVPPASANPSTFQGTTSDWTAVSMTVRIEP